MKKFLPIFIILSFIFYLLSFPIKADFSQAYRDYLNQYDLYRTSLTDYLTNKNRYLTYQTLSSKTEALTSTKTFLQNRDLAIFAYLNLLLDKNPPETYQKLINDEITFYTNHQQLVNSIGSLDDCVDVSNDLEDHFPATSAFARQTVAGLVLKKLQNIDNRLNSLETSFDQQISLVKQQGKDASTLERWFLEAKNKRVLAQNKIRQIQDEINSLEPNLDLNEQAQKYAQIQALFSQTNQYYKETISYYKEIKEELKYGNY